MKAWAWLLSISLSLAACMTARSQKKPERNLSFFPLYTEFLAKPTAKGLERIRAYVAAYPGNKDLNLELLAKRDAINKKLIPRIRANVAAGDILTLRSLIILAVDLRTETGVERGVGSEAEQLLRRMGSRQPRTKFGPHYLLAVEFAIAEPARLLEALGAEWTSRDAKSRARLLEETLDYALFDTNFRPDCQRCPATHLEFVSEKKNRLNAALESTPVGPDFRAEVERSRLFVTTASPLLEFRISLNQPNDQNFARLREACAYMGANSQRKPSINDLSEETQSYIRRSLQSGDTDVARSLAILVAGGCWTEIDELQGPKPWLGLILLCRQPQAFLSAMAKERVARDVVADLVRYVNPDPPYPCDGGEGSGSEVRRVKMAKLLGLKPQNPEESALQMQLRSLR